MAAEVMRVIDDLADDEQFQATMVIVSHDIAAVSRVADTLTILERGQVIFSGPVAQAPPGYLG
jgi:polar amino acid transport system ATP-binding protein